MNPPSKFVVSIISILTLQVNTHCLAAPTASVSPATSLGVHQNFPPLDVRQEIPIERPTPILDSAVDGRQISQSPEGMPVLRQGISTSSQALENRIDLLTRDILLKQIELERYGINYNMEVGKQGRWKGWRYGAFGEANLSLGLAGGIISVHNRGSKLHTPSSVNVRVQESANYIPMIGNIIGASAAGFEYSVNEWHAFQAKQKGFSPKQARVKVKTLRGEIQGLLDQREKLVREEANEPALATRVKLDDAEQRVLKDMFAQNLQQFERFYLDKRKLLAFQQMQYMFDIAKNVTSAVGYELAYLSLHEKKRIYNGRAGVLFTVSGGLYMAGPVVSRLFANWVVKRHRKLLRPSTETAEEATLEALKKDHDLLNQICAQSDCPKEKVEIVVNRSASIYASGEKHFEDNIERSETSIDKAKLVATQNIAAGAYVGGTKVTSGIFFLIPGFNSAYNTSGYRADRATNNNLFVSSLISIPASAFAIADTLRINIKGERNRSRLKKQGALPSQLAQTRLAELDKIEAAVKQIGI